MPLPTESGRPVLTTNIVVFTLRDEQLKLLLIRRRNAPFEGCWSLPGGVVGTDEDVEANAMRKLEDSTGLSGIYLEQLYTFSAPERDPRERVISVAYYALVASKRLQLRTDADSEGVGWFSLNELPELAFDHAQMVDTAHQRLAAKLDYSTIAFQFMPELFTLSDLQNVFQIILNRDLDKRNFRKRMRAMEQIRQTSQVQKTGSHRPARLYRVNNPHEVRIIK
ncbi:MAG: NUDIX domain-containing protein [Gammaproteobacteria bacterium]|jgi:8-oxo-dGTP diphosphatase|nr:NUDIX domain-containing protein [Gammaproteobacteria bacterium]NCF80595.1 NUDIX domain-containing protein [Pseudomonadota bacterium]